MTHALAPLFSWGHVVQTSHLALSALATGITLTSSDPSLEQKITALFSNLAGSLATLPKTLYPLYVTSSVGIGLVNVLLTPSSAVSSSIQDSTETPSKRDLATKIHEVALSVTVGYQSALAMAASMFLYVSIAELFSSLDPYPPFQYAGLALAVVLPAYYTELSRLYSGYPFLTLQNGLSQGLAYAISIKMASLLIDDHEPQNHL